MEVAFEFSERLPEWINVVAVKDFAKQQILETQVDKGEASAIALSYEIENYLLILDDYKARRLANKLELKFTGIIGVLIKAKQSGIIPKIKPVLNKIVNTNFRISESIMQEALRICNELP